MLVTTLFFLVGASLAFSQNIEPIPTDQFPPVRPPIYKLTKPLTEPSQSGLLRVQIEENSISSKQTKPRPRPSHSSLLDLQIEDIPATSQYAKPQPRPFQTLLFKLGDNLKIKSEIHNLKNGDNPPINSLVSHQIEEKIQKKPIDVSESEEISESNSSQDDLSESSEIEERLSTLQHTEPNLRPSMHKSGITYIFFKFHDSSPINKNHQESELDSFQIEEESEMSQSDSFQIEDESEMRQRDSFQIEDDSEMNELDSLHKIEEMYPEISLESYETEERLQEGSIESPQLEEWSQNSSSQSNSLESQSEEMPNPSVPTKSRSRSRRSNWLYGPQIEERQPTFAFKQIKPRPRPSQNSRHRAPIYRIGNDGYY